MLDANYDTYAGSAAFLALVDQNGNVLAHAGSRSNDEEGIYLVDETLPKYRNPRDAGFHPAAGWRIRVGLKTAAADFIRRTAYLQLILSGLAVIALIVLSFYLVRMVRRFLELKDREAEEVQLRALGTMAASLAHEIRNPLGAMKGLTQLVQEELPPDHASQAQLRTVVNESERLEKLVSDLLDFARRKDPEIASFDLVELLSDIQTMLQTKLEASGITLRISPDPDSLPLRSDPAGLRQVMLNVLLNAVEAAGAGGTIAVTASRDEKTKSIIVHVDDSGAGLGSKTFDELAQPFVTTRAQGTGLGLAISKQIIESLGGELSLSNLPGGGARCSVIIPIR